MSTTNIISQNKHLEQAFQPGYVCVKRNDIPRYIDHGDEKDYSGKSIYDQAKYNYKDRRKLKEKISVCHWGQRKLFLSELEFCIKHGNRSKFVIYVGAAPGNHLNYLVQMFPEFLFHLYDPLNFDKDLEKKNNVKIFNRYFTDEDCRDYVKNKDFNCLLISDIRNADYIVSKFSSEEDKAKTIYDDMKLQEGWIEILNPEMSLLKFKLPWSDSKTEYFEGTISLPIFGRYETAESRLIVPKNPRKVFYDNRKYEKEMYYFNTVTRVSYFEDQDDFSSYQDVTGLCHCYDCSCEIKLFKDYIQSDFNCCFPKDKDLMKSVFTASETLTKIINVKIEIVVDGKKILKIRDLRDDVSEKQQYHENTFKETKIDPMLRNKIDKKYNMKNVRVVELLKGKLVPKDLSDPKSKIYESEKGYEIMFIGKKELNEIKELRSLSVFNDYFFFPIIDFSYTKNSLALLFPAEINKINIMDLDKEKVFLYVVYFVKFLSDKVLYLDSLSVKDFNIVRSKTNFFNNDEVLNFDFQLQFKKYNKIKFGNIDIKKVLVKIGLELSIKNDEIDKFVKMIKS